MACFDSHAAIATLLSAAKIAYLKPVPVLLCTLALSFQFHNGHTLKDSNDQQQWGVSLEPDLSGLLQHLLHVIELIVSIKKGNSSGVGVHEDSCGQAKHIFYFC